MPLIRATWFFQQQGYGWTENLWLNGTDSDLNSYTGKVNDYAVKRAVLSGNETFIIGARWSVENVFRDALGLDFPGSGLQGKTTQESDSPDTALLVHMRNTGGTKRRNHFLRGVWDSVVKTGGLYTPTAAWTGYLNAWKAEISQKGWGWLTRGNRVQQNVTAVIQTAGGQVDVTTAGVLFPLPLPSSANVSISGVSGAFQINGPQIVVPTQQDRFLTRNRIAIFLYNSGGRVTYTTPVFQGIDEAGVSRVVERKVGRPSGKSPGRRKARARI